MCQNLGISSSKLVHDLPARNYRRQMKPILPRKATASARINLNKFWNDLEEFYSRYDDRRSSNNNNPLIDVYMPLPNYTTDTYDHDREAAENDLNEKMEAEKFRERMEKAQAEVEVLMAARDKHDQEVGRLRAEIDKVESARARLQLDQERAHSDVNIIQVNLFSLKIYKPQPLCSIFGPFQK